MSQTITCPACTLRLTLPAEYMGRQVRCPSCHAEFIASAEAPPPPVPAPSEGGFPNLSLDDGEPTPAKTPAPREEAPEPPPPSRREEPPPERRSPSSRRDRIDYDDDEDEEDRPWERPYRRRVRRDCEPHRGSLVLTFGIISVVALAICGPLGLPFGIMAWWMGSGDLAKMRAGTMDPEGEGSTQAGWVCGIIGTIIDGLMTLGCLAYIGFIFFMIYVTASSVPTTRPAPRPRFVAPDVQPRLEHYLPGPRRC